MHHDPIIEDIRHFRENKAAQYGYDAEVAMKDFVRMHKALMKTRGLLPSAGNSGSRLAKHQLRAQWLQGQVQGQDAPPKSLSKT